MGRTTPPRIFHAVRKKYARMRNRTDGVCSQTAAPIRHTALAASAAYLCGQLHHIGLIRYGPPVLRSILRTCGSRGDRPDRQGFIYFSEDLSAGHDEPFRQTAVPDLASSGAGCLVSVGAAFKSRERRLKRCTAFAGMLSAGSGIGIITVHNLCI